jgi:ribonuclease J
MMAEITFYGGVGETDEMGEIGGNKILIDDNGTKVMLDFGRRMGEAGKFYEEFIQIRSKCALLDLLKLGILPEINGIYPEHLLNKITLVKGNDEGPSEDELILMIPLADASDYWQNLTIAPYNTEDPILQAVFISHAHFDHIQDLSFLHRDIPIYCTKTTEVLAKAITDISDNNPENQFYETDLYEKLSLEAKNPSTSSKTIFPKELVYKKGDDEKPVEEPKTGYIFTKMISSMVRNYITELAGEIGSIQYKIIPIGHSVPGASSILLTTSDNKRILYTGDIRFHGENEPTLEEFLVAVGEDPIDVLICEGTRIDSENELTEEDVYQDMLDQARDTEGLLLVDFGWKDVTRFKTIARVAREIDRTFVINPKMAYLLYELYAGVQNGYDDPTEFEDIKVYKKRQEDHLYSKLDYKKFKAGYIHHWGKNQGKGDKNLVRLAEKLGIGGRPDAEQMPLTAVEQKTWDLALHHIEHGITAYEIRNDPEKYILMFTFWDANELFDLSTVDGEIIGAKYIRASCEPFNDEMEIDEKKLMQWLDKFGIVYEPEIDENDNTFFKRAHVSGHASRPELKEMIRKINPSSLIPVHTEKPEAFKKIIDEIDNDIELKIPVMCEKYTF